MSYLNTELKIFKFEDGEDHWVVARNKEEAVKWFENEYIGEVLEDGYEVTELTKDDDTCINCREDEDLIKIMNRYKSFDRNNADEICNNSYIPIWTYLKYWIIEHELQERETVIPNLLACSVC